MPEHSPDLTISLSSDVMRLPDGVSYCHRLDRPGRPHKFGAWDEGQKLYRWKSFADLAVAMTRAELRVLVLDAAEQGAAKALASFQRGPERMSACRAAKRARARLADVLQVLKDGSLPGRFSPRGHGGRGSYSILSTDIDVWADARR